MKYEKVVKQWNNFCIESGIRDYCQNKCKGYCCEGVLNYCEKQCKDSIACTSYLCFMARRALPKEVADVYYSYLSRVSRRIKKITGGRHSDQWGQNLAGTVYWQDPKDLIEKLLTNVDWAKTIGTWSYHNSPRNAW